MSKEIKELKNRLNAEKLRLEARLHEAKAEGFSMSEKARKATETKIKEAESFIKETTHDVGEELAGRINAWLRKQDEGILVESKNSN